MKRKGQYKFVVWLKLTSDASSHHVMHVSQEGSYIKPLDDARQLTLSLSLASLDMFTDNVYRWFNFDCESCNRIVPTFCRKFVCRIVKSACRRRKGWWKNLPNAEMTKPMLGIQRPKAQLEAKDLPKQCRTGQFGRSKRVEKIGVLLKKNWRYLCIWFTLGKLRKFGFLCKNVPSPHPRQFQFSQLSYP